MAILASPYFLAVWAALAAISLGFLLYDLRNRNPEIGGLMKLVWILTVSYSGPIGLAVYTWSGRKQIARDSLWRRAFRSVSHCYSGCGAGEIVGVFIAAGLFSLGSLWVSVITFVLAYIAGFALTVGPLMQEGVSFGAAFRDAALAETPSITVMEIVAIGVGQMIAGSASLGDTLFWSGLIVSLTCGLVAAYPVNVLLIHWGVKEGMHDPREMAKHAGHGD